MNKAIVLEVIFLQVLFHFTTCQYPQYGAISLDPKIDSCIRSPYVYEEYKQLLVITDLRRAPLREIALKPVQPENVATHNLFLSCSWKLYNYMDLNGTVRYDNIERDLAQAIINSIGKETGAGNNLSNAEAKNIISQCHSEAFTPGLKAIQVQNCILQRIQRFAHF